MCWMIASNPEEVFEGLIRNERRNPHGWGIAWVDDGELRWQSGLSRVPDFRDIDPDDGKMVGHVRFASDGGINEMNTHPFPVKDENGLFGLLFHNGTFDSKKREMVPHKGIEGTSDTADIARLLSSLLHDHPWKRVRALYEALCGETVILLTRDTIWAYRGRYPLTDIGDGVATSGGEDLSRGWHEIE